MMATYKHREKVYEIPFPQSQSLSAREMGMEYCTIIPDLIWTWKTHEYSVFESNIK